MYYTHALLFPFTKTLLNFKEFNNKQFINLLKINTNLPPDPDYRIDYHQNLIEIISGCVKDKSKIFDLNIIEFLMFCIRLRTISIGTTLELSLTNDNKKDKNKKIILNFFDLLQNVFSISESIKKYQIIKENETEIHLNWPMLKDEEFFLEITKEDQLEKLLKSIPLFIERIIIKDQVFEFKKFDPKQKNLLLESVPLSIKNIIQTNVFSLLKEISLISLFGEIEEFSEYKLEFFNATIQDLIRLLFSGNENIIFQENLFLKKYNFNLDEIENMTPIEKANYIHYYVEQIQQNNENQNLNSIKS